MEILTKYKVTFGTLIYKVGVLVNIELDNSVRNMQVLPELPINERDLPNSGLSYKPLKITSSMQKIALWCELYQLTYSMPYKVTTAESGMVAKTEFTQELIVSFFNSTEWYANEKTITRYVRNYNDIVRIATGNKPKQSAGGSAAKTRTNRADLAAEFERRYKN